MANFTANQSLNGIQTITIFTAPSAGSYFVNGQLQLPNSEGAGPSSVVATVKKNGSGIYTGAAGATGFQFPSLALAAGDVISVQLDSSAAVDLVTNAVTGTVAVSQIS